MSSIEYIYLGNDNAIELILKEDGVAVDLSGVTRTTLSFDSTTIDSATVGFGAGLAFDVSEGSGKLVMRLGDLVDGLGAPLIPVGHYAAELVIYDSEHDDGIVWGKINIRVYS